MNKKELKQLIEQIIKEENFDVKNPSNRIVGMSKNYLFKEQIMKMVQEAVASSQDAVKSQDDYVRVIQGEIDNIKSDMDVTYDMVQKSLEAIPFEIFYKALGRK